MSSKIRSASFWACCFAAPIVMLAAVCAWNGVHPFGQESFLTEDAKYQYIDLYTWFRRVLLGDGSPFYLANTGLGTNAWGLVGYYLSSPFCLLLVFFDEDHLTDFFWVMTALKLGCIQVSAAWYLRRRFSVPRFTAFALALCYTWSSWTATQMRNPLWLDALILLPLAAYGVFLLVRDSRWLPLTAALAVAVITCWYTAYMMILFLCLLIVLELTAFSVEVPKALLETALKRIALFALSVFVALLLAAFTFAPTVMAMLGGSKGSVFMGVTMTGFRQLISSFFLGNWAVDAVPQHYAGTLLAIAALAFLLATTIPKRVRVVSALLLAFMIASAFFTPLLYVWSGFRMPMGFYCRIAFLTVFLALWMAGCACSALCRSELPARTIVAAAVIVVVAVVAVCCAGLFAHVRYAVVSVALCALLAALLIAGQRGGLAGKWRIGASLALCACVFAELLYGAHIDWSQLYRGYAQEYHESYVSNARAQIDELRAYDDGVYRVDKTYTRAGYAALNEGATRDYLALSTYASSQDIAAVNMLNGLGYSIEGEFLTRYSDSVLVADSILGVKYVSSDMQPTGFADVGLMEVEHGDGGHGAKFYRNPYALALGYGVDSGAAGFALPAEGNPFERQNGLASALAGEEVVLYRPLASKVAIESDGYLQYAVEVPAGAIGYAYTSIPTGDSVQLTLDDDAPMTDNWRWRHAVTALGGVSSDIDVHHVSISTGSTPLDSIEPLPEGASCLFYYLDMQAFSSFIERLAAHELSISAFESGHVEAEYHADEAGYVMFSMPATRGWAVSVNGQPVECDFLCEGGLMLVPVSAGANAIVMDFTPPGFLAGCGISLATLLLVLVFAWNQRRRRRCR